MHDVFGVRCGTNDAQGVPIKRSLLSPREILERSRIAIARALDETLDLAF